MNILFLTISIIIIIKNVLCEYGLSKTNVTLNFLKQSEIKKCRNDNDCPEYYNNCFIPQSSSSGYCNMYLFCHETGNCLKLSLGEFEIEERYRWPYYKTESYDYYKISMNSCDINTLAKIRKHNMTNIGDITDNIKDEWGFFEDCKRSTCTKNEECFSKKCNIEEEVCETNESSPAYVCTLNIIENNNYKEECLLMNHEKCSYNGQCLSNICDGNFSICVNKNSNLSFLELVVYYFRKYYLIILAIFFLTLVIISIIARISKARIKSKEIVFAR
ncbi:hypothetical protein LY90DRAFT_676348 [Neocallimastix californiae]|jgi:hypothetical protein|uniref:Uncharacterized protein n=1 Tax=Neocallimastix californiae TaxID=1754190 RepID=A0A1Y2AFJ6_9FUNG|nr:hypothetical protein LY90DRAFT_676348 [Neocallimastix californiae]|eukprot:ORY21276.1 hypothetical protein LY90DRAFT_676348 [Neocallimastix californiae]